MFRSPICVNGHDKRVTGVRGRACKVCADSHAKRYADHSPQAKRRWAWRKQGIVNFTTADYERLHAAQSGLCANLACGRPIKLYGSGRSTTDANVDHDHATGRVRGLLCRSCNIGLGHLGDDERGVLGILSYLQPEYGGINAGCM